MSNIFVAGSINMDVVATADRHPRVGETIVGTSLEFIPGGKGANQAVAAAKLGARTTLIGRVGDDSFADPLLRFLKEAGLTLSVEKVPDCPTGTALIVVAGGDNSIVVVPGANFALTPESVELSTIAPGDLCVAQFEVPVSTIVSFFKHAKSRGAKTILNPAPAREIADDLRHVIDIIILNETELATLTGLNVDPTNSESLKTAAEALRGTSTVNIIVTIGAGGAVAYFDGQVCQSKGHTVVAVDSTGAGDCFVGAFASSLANSSSLRDALEFATAAAAISVTRKGAGPSMPTMDEVKALTDK